MITLIIISLGVIGGILWYLGVFDKKKTDVKPLGGTTTSVNLCKTFTFTFNGTDSSRVVYENCDGQIRTIELSEEKSICGKSILILGPNITVKELPFCAV